VSNGRDFYEILGVERSASAEEIKRAYKRLAIQHHPDRNPDDPTAEERFRDASQAYQVLSDKDKRTRYDRMGHAAFTSTGNPGFDGGDFGSMSEILEGLLGDMFGRRRQRGARDLTYDLEITFVEAALGCDKAIEVDRPSLCDDCSGSGAAAGTQPTACPTCSGKGQVRFQRGIFATARPCSTCGGNGKQIDDPCKTCRGTGTVTKKEALSVKIPAGVEDGSVRTVRGAGEQTPKGTGDLHVYVRVKEHSIFTREGADVLCTVPVGFPQAVLGANLDIPTLEGMVRMKLPPGTQSGKIFRLRGKGVPVFGGAGKGDQLVRVVVEVPEKINRKQRKLLEELADEMGTDTMPQRQNFLSKLKDIFE
jgi:molecular chaperone DnaJ